MPTASAAEPALLRIAHLSPDSPAVDVALTPVPSGGGPLTDPGPDVATGLGYGDVGDYRELAPGSYAVSVRAAGAPADTPPALTERIDLPAGGARTLTLAGLFEDLAVAVLTDDLSTPPAGSARVRVIAAAAGAPVTVTTTAGTPLAEALPFPDAGRYVTVPAGTTGIRVMDGGPELSLGLAAGSVVSVLLVDTPDGGRRLRPVLDATGSAVVPVGGVDAGTGPVGVPLVGAAVTAGLHRPQAAAPAVPVAAPVRLRAPAVGIDAAVTAVGPDAVGELAAPADPAVAGWFAGGPVPGSPGPAVLAGHVDWAGSPAVFGALAGLVPGDEITVERADGTVARFTVTRVLRVAKDAFPTAEVYGPTPDAELRLITCGGRFDRAAGSYADNVVVWAKVT